MSLFFKIDRYICMLDSFLDIAYRLKYFLKRLGWARVRIASEGCRPQQGLETCFWYNKELNKRDRRKWKNVNILTCSGSSKLWKKGKIVLKIYRI